MIDDPFDVLYCVIRSRCVALNDLPRRPFWNLIPNELKTVLEEAIASGTMLEHHHHRRISEIRTTMSGHPRLRSPASKNDFVYALLGFHFLNYREGKNGWDELLTRAFRVADSYGIEIDGVRDSLDAGPFLRLRNELRGRDFTDGDNELLHTLFVPYIALAEACVHRWGLKTPPTPTT